MKNNITFDTLFPDFPASHQMYAVLKTPSAQKHSNFSTAKLLVVSHFIILVLNPIEFMTSPRHQNRAKSSLQIITDNHLVLPEDNGHFSPHLSIAPVFATILTTLKIPFQTHIFSGSIPFYFSQHSFLGYFVNFSSLRLVRVLDSFLF